MYSFQGTDISCLARNLTSMCLKHSLVARVMVMNPWICFLQNWRQDSVTNDIAALSNCCSTLSVTLSQLLDPVQVCSMSGNMFVFDTSAHRSRRRRKPSVIHSFLLTHGQARLFLKFFWDGVAVELYYGVVTMAPLLKLRVLCAAYCVYMLDMTEWSCISSHCLLKRWGTPAGASFIKLTLTGS